MTAPLELEPVRAPTGFASTEVEDFHTAIDRLLHQARIQKHVRRQSIVFPERRCPRNLELIAPVKAASPGYRTPVLLYTAANSIDGPNDDAPSSKNARGSTGVPRSRMFRANTS